MDIILTLEGYYCIPVLEGNEAINIILKKKFDIIFFDEKIKEINLNDIISSLQTLNLSLPVFVIRSTPQDQEIVKDQDNNIYYIDHSLISEKLPQVIKATINNN